ncbi:MAG: ScpA family protein [Fusobacterium sp. JB021]|nr:ScpA family protein [Fusobacterium sp. JB020]MDP0493265.1 ScpA family protein [Fusobacterium sp. JB021]MDP0506080.1 ScpA family protein [Fusobacterium sp. JB019]
MMLKDGEKSKENKDEIVFKLDNFEGPLELLIYLIEKKKVKISEVKISQIIDEYLEIMEDLKNQSLDIKVEFLIMATELLEIKAKSILSIDKEKDSEKELKRKLEEYKLFKQVTTEVRKIENEFNISYSKKDGKQIKKVESKEYDLNKLTLEDVYKTYKKFIDKQEKEFIEIKYEKTYSIEDEKEKILISIYEEEKSLETLFEISESRMHLVYIFLALLDFYKEGVIDIISIEETIFIKRF